MKYSSDTIENRTRNLPVCSAMPQPTAPPRAPITIILFVIPFNCNSFLSRKVTYVQAVGRNSDTRGNHYVSHAVYYEHFISAPKFTKRLLGILGVGVGSLSLPPVSTFRINFRNISNKHKSHVFNLPASNMPVNPISKIK
jgi:hypothetical protein